MVVFMISELNFNDMTTSLSLQETSSKTEPMQDVFKALQGISCKQQEQLLPYLFKKIEVFQWFEKVLTAQQDGRHLEFNELCLAAESNQDDLMVGSFLSSMFQDDAPALTSLRTQVVAQPFFTSADSSQRRQELMRYLFDTLAIIQWAEELYTESVKVPVMAANGSKITDLLLQAKDYPNSLIVRQVLQTIFTSFFHTNADVLNLMFSVFQSPVRGFLDAFDCSAIIPYCLESKYEEAAVWALSCMEEDEVEEFMERPETAFLLEELNSMGTDVMPRLVQKLEEMQVSHLKDDSVVFSLADTARA